MARTKYCPNCDSDISDSYESADPEVGIMVGGWYCQNCDETIPREPEDDE